MAVTQDPDAKADSAKGTPVQQAAVSQAVAPARQNAATVLKLLLMAAAALVLLGQAASLVGVLAANVDTQPVIAAIDNDGGVAISVAIGTKLYDDNGWRPYGPLYYRLVRIMSGGASDGGVPELTKAGEASASSLESRLQADRAQERRHHFLLMLVSLVSLYGLALMLSCLVTDQWLWRLIATPLLVAVLSSHRTWAEMVLRPHPDHLFALLIAVAVWRTITWLSSSSVSAGNAQEGALAAQDRHIAAGAWGLAAATKLSVLPFALGGLFLFLHKESGKRLSWRWREALAFVGVAFATYLAVSFPQGFNFLGVFEFLVQQSARNFRPADAESIRQWFDLFASHSWAPALCVLMLAAVLPRDRSSAASARALAMGFALILAPVIYLFGKKILSPIDWYPLPFVAAGLVWLALFVGALRLRLLPRPLIGALNSRRVSLAFALLGLVAWPFFIPPVPASWGEELHEWSSCRTEARVAEQRVNAVALSHRGLRGAVLADPLYPYARAFHDREVDMRWEMSSEAITPKTKAFALKSAYYTWYLPASEGGQGREALHLKEPERVAEFYRLFWRKDEASTPDGRRWTKTLVDQCGFELWEPVAPGEKE